MKEELNRLVRDAYYGQQNPKERDRVLVQIANAYGLKCAHELTDSYIKTYGNSK